MEMGSFIEMQFYNGIEFYSGKNTIKLNSGRAGILHALKCFNCDTVYLPYYECESVRDFLIENRIKINYYSIKSSFEPVLASNNKETSIVIVNYFGVMSNEKMINIAQKFNNVIIDNSQAFYAKPIDRCLNVYSTRKFFGVPDGCYVVGDMVSNINNQYEQDYSSDTCQYLLERIEYGCEGKAYQNRMQNEERIANSGIKKMSKLSQRILASIDYKIVSEKRKENFDIVDGILNEKNLLKFSSFLGESYAPMVYPLVIEDLKLLQYLKFHNIILIKI